MIEIACADSGSMPPVFNVLGPMSVRSKRGEVTITSPRQRVVLAALLRSANCVVSIDQLADVLWNGRPTSAATSTIYSYVMRLRRTLGPVLGARIRTDAGGYVLTAAPEEIDIGQFERHRSAGKQALDENDWEAAATRFAEAAALWRGEPYADVPADALRCDEAGRLRQQWLTVREWQNEAELELGRLHEVIARLRHLVAEYPLREPFTEQMMRALSQAGRPAEAVVVYESARQSLIGEIGLGPGRELKSRLDEILEAWPDTGDGWNIGRQPAPPAPAQLPAGLPDFTGREAAVAGICAAVLRAARPNTVTVVTITGAAGVGKTALALHAGHLLRDGFSDGQLFVDLGGSSDRPLSAGEALARFLRALSVPASAVPDATDERGAFLRSALAGRRVLLVLDDALDADQVRPLLPGGGNCAVIVTTRSRLTRLPGDQNVALDPLSPDESRALFAQVVGVRRVAAEPQDARAVIHACDGLPLALRVAGSRITGRPGWAIGTLAERLRDELHRLDELRWGKEAVRCRIDTSLRRLPTGGAADPTTVFTRLGMCGMPDIGLAACSALTGASVRDTEASLDMLVDLHLVEQNSLGRYRLGDLLRNRAIELAELRGPGDRVRAVGRLAQWYQSSADRADLLLATGGESLARTDASRWFHQERHCLPIAVRAAVDCGLQPVAQRLTVLIARYADPACGWAADHAMA